MTDTTATPDTQVTQAPLASQELIDTSSQVADTLDVTEGKAAAKPLDTSSRAFAALSRKDKELRLAKQQLEASKSELTAKEQAIADRAAAAERYEQLKGRAKEKPLDILSELGLTHDAVLAAIVDSLEPKDPEIVKINDELRALKEERDEVKRQAEEREKQRVQERIASALDDYKTSIAHHIKSEPEKYELINALGEHDAVFELIDAHFTKTNTMYPGARAIDAMTASEAAEANKRAIAWASDEVEALLLEEARKFANSKKLDTLRNSSKAQSAGSKLDKADGASAGDSDIAKQISKSRITSSTVSSTLSNRRTVHDGSKGTDAASSRQLSEQERIQRAIALLG